MNFKESVISGFKNYITIKGRASRAEFWWWTLFINAGALFLLIVLPFLAQFFIYGTLLPTLSLMVRRLHDTNRGAEWMVGMLALALYSWTTMPEVESLQITAAGTLPTEVVDAIQSVMWVTLIVWTVYIILFSLPSIKGENRFGQEPNSQNDNTSLQG